MAEKIINGAFTSDLSSWTNIGADSFGWVAGRAHAASSSLSPESHILIQDFGISGAVFSALLDIFVYWDLPATEISEGEVVFNVRLVDPNGGSTLVATHTQNSPGTGNLHLCDALGVSSYMTLVGTYTLRLEAICTAGEAGNKPYIRQSHAYYDNVSLVVVERFFKTVLEGIGGGDALGSGVPGGGFQGALEKIGGHETLTANGGEDLVAGLFTDTQSEAYGLHEFLLAKIPATVSDPGIGMKEFGPIRTYGGRNTPENTVGLDESLVARWQQGNVGVRRDIILGDDAWTDLAKAATVWETI